MYVLRSDIEYTDHFRLLFIKNYKQVIVDVVSSGFVMLTCFD